MNRVGAKILPCRKKGIKSVSLYETDIRSDPGSVCVRSRVGNESMGEAIPAALIHRRRSFLAVAAPHAFASEVPVQLTDDRRGCFRNRILARRPSFSVFRRVCQQAFLAKQQFHRSRPFAPGGCGERGLRGTTFDGMASRSDGGVGTFSRFTRGN